MSQKASTRSGLGITEVLIPTIYFCTKEEGHAIIFGLVKLISVLLILVKKEASKLLRLEPSKSWRDITD